MWNPKATDSFARIPSRAPKQQGTELYYQPGSANTCDDLAQYPGYTGENSHNASTRVLNLSPYPELIAGRLGRVDATDQGIGAVLDAARTQRCL
jgi:hypothetical protein